MVNTLVLAYAGAALPLLLLFSVAQSSVGTVANSELVAEEIVRTLVGPIGLAASVPVTTLLAALVVSADRRQGGVGAGDGRLRSGSGTGQSGATRACLMNRYWSVEHVPQRTGDSGCAPGRLPGAPAV